MKGPDMDGTRAKTNLYNVYTGDDAYKHKHEKTKATVFYFSEIPSIAQTTFRYSIFKNPGQSRFNSRADLV